MKIVKAAPPKLEAFARHAESRGALGSPIRLEGRVLGERPSLEEVGTEHTTPVRKVLATVGAGFTTHLAAAKGMAALGMSATARRVAWAAEARGGPDRPIGEAAAIEKQASAFDNPLRLPLPARAWIHPAAGLPRAGEFAVRRRRRRRRRGALRRSLDLALGETEIPLVLQDRNCDAQGRLPYQVSGGDHSDCAGTGGMRFAAASIAAANHISRQLRVLAGTSTDHLFAAIHLSN